MKRPTIETSPGIFMVKKHTIPPAVMAHRMQRYSLLLMILAFFLLVPMLNALTLENVLWFAATIVAVFAIMCAVTVVILHALAWNFDRIKQELRGGREADEMR